MVYAPGRDRYPAVYGNPRVQNSAAYVPSQGAGGVFAGYIQGMTPKYAFNAGLRDDMWRNTLARMFIRVNAEEMALFTASINDVQVRERLATRIAGDPVGRQESRVTASGAVSEGAARYSNSEGTNGYLDFFIQQASMPLQEKFDVKETLADNYTAEFFGQQPPMWSYSGWLMNTVQDDQATNFLRLYLSVLRGTQLARRQKIIALKVDSYIVSGAMVNLNMTITSNAEIYIPFSFSLLVKSVKFVNFTRGWTPTRANTVFAADPNDIPYDGRPAGTGSLRRIVAQMGEDVVQLGPSGEVTSDPRVHAPPVRPDALAPAPVAEDPAGADASVFDVLTGAVGARLGGGAVASAAVLALPAAVAGGVALAGLTGAAAVGSSSATDVLNRLSDAVDGRPPAPTTPTPETRSPPRATTPIPGTHP